MADYEGLKDECAPTSGAFPSGPACPLCKRAVPQPDLGATWNGQPAHVVCVKDARARGDTGSSGLPPDPPATDRTTHMEVEPEPDNAENDSPVQRYARWGGPMDNLRNMVPLLPPQRRDEAERWLDALTAERKRLAVLATGAKPFRPAVGGEHARCPICRMPMVPAEPVASFGLYTAHAVCVATHSTIGKPASVWEAADPYDPPPAQKSGDVQDMAKLRERLSWLRRECLGTLPPDVAWLVYRTALAKVPALPPTEGA